MSDGQSPVSALVDALAAYLGAARGEAVTVQDVTRLSGGASHETWGFVATTASGTRDALILRRDHARTLVDGDLEREYALLEHLHAAGLPVARPWYRETDATILGAPFMIVERVIGTDLRKALAASSEHDRVALGRALVAVQVALHGSALPATVMSEDEAVADSRREVARWQAITEPARRPLLCAASAWLVANVPTPAPACLVHGDFKANNIVYGSDGALTVIDWEMAHVGDAHEDLAWTLLWTTQDDLVGGLLERDAYLAAYAEASAISVDRERLFFWEVLALLKLAAIFLRAAPGDDARAPLPSHLMLHRALADVETRLAQRLLRTVAAETPVAPSTPPSARMRAGNAGHDPFTTLSHLRNHLAHTLLPIVPREHIGELRAALKLIEECSGELDGAPVALVADCAALDELIKKIDAYAPEIESGTIPERVSLNTCTTGLYAAFAARETWLAKTLPRLLTQPTADAAAALSGIYSELGQQACRRANWQSVFPCAAKSRSTET